MAALTETRRYRLSDCFGAPAEDVLGPMPSPKPIPVLRKYVRRVLADIVDWSPTTAMEIAESLKSYPPGVHESCRELEALGLISRRRPKGQNNQPWIITPTPEGRRVVRVLEFTGGR